MDLPLQVEGLGAAALGHSRADGRAPGLREGIPPCAPDLHDLRPVQQAAAGERHHVRLQVAPGRQRGGPLLRAPHLVGLLAGEDHPAVDDARDHRGEALPRGRHHRLVEEGDALAGPLGLDQDPAPLEGGEPEQVAIAEPLADRRGIGGDRRGGLRLAGGRAPERERQQHVAALGALARLGLQQPLGAAEPTRRAAHRAGEGQRHPDPERAANGAQGLAGVEVRLVRALEAAQEPVLQSDHVRRARQQLEIVGLQPDRLVGARQRVVRLPPGPPGVRGPSALRRGAGVRGGPHGRGGGSAALAGARAPPRSGLGSSSSRTAATALRMPHLLARCASRIAHPPWDG